MSVFTRYVKKSLVENPYITLTAGLCIVGMAMPTWVYYNGGREKEAAMRFDLVRSVKKGGERTHTERWRVVEANGWKGWLARARCGARDDSGSGGRRSCLRLRPRLRRAALCTRRALVRACTAK